MPALMKSIRRCAAVPAPVVTPIEIPEPQRVGYDGNAEVEGREVDTCPGPAKVGHLFPSHESVRLEKDDLVTGAHPGIRVEEQLERRQDSRAAAS